MNDRIFALATIVVALMILAAIHGFAIRSVMDRVTALEQQLERAR